MCRLCFAIKEGGDTYQENMVLFETENFVVMPTRGQFVEGWVMIVSKKHYKCFAQQKKSEINEFESLLEKTKNILGKKYSKAIAFEHGPSEKVNIHAGCCIEHTHIHVVPYVIGEQLFKLIDFNFEKFSCLERLYDSVNYGDGYLFLQDEKGKNYKSIVDRYIPKQYMRKVIARLLGRNSFWDWRIYNFEDNIRSTIKTLGSNIFI